MSLVRDDSKRTAAPAVRNVKCFNSGGVSLLQFEPPLCVMSLGKKDKQ